MKQPYNKKVSHYNANPFEKPDKTPKQDMVVAIDYEATEKKVISDLHTSLEPLAYGEPGIISEVDSTLFAYQKQAMEKIAKKFHFVGSVHDSIVVAHKKKDDETLPQSLSEESMKQSIADLKTLAALSKGSGKTISIPMQHDTGFSVGDKVGLNGKTFFVTKVKDDDGNYKFQYKPPVVNSGYEMYKHYHSFLTHSFIRAKPTVEELADKFLEEPTNKQRTVHDLLVDFAKEQLLEQAGIHNRNRQALNDSLDTYRHRIHNLKEDNYALRQRISELEDKLAKQESHRATVIASAIVETGRTRLFRES